MSHFLQYPTFLIEHYIFYILKFSTINNAHFVCDEPVGKFNVCCTLEKVNICNNNKKKWKVWFLLLRDVLTFLTFWFLETYIYCALQYQKWCNFVKNVKIYEVLYLQNSKVGCCPHKKLPPCIKMIWLKFWLKFFNISWVYTLALNILYSCIQQPYCHNKATVSKVNIGSFTSKHVCISELLSKDFTSLSRCMLQCCF